MISDDMALVQEYAESNSEQAFATLVSRHLNLVYSVALRHVHDPHLAEDISQGVFTLLARKAKSLSSKTILSGWLCRTARYVAANTLSIERRRRCREEEAQMQRTLREPEPSAWNQIAPMLDEALERLGEKEHDAVVLRFFDGKELKQVGAAMGISEDAARMRVNRGIEKLRAFFGKKGVALSTTAIAGAVAANSIQAAPAGLAVTITTAALAGTTTTTSAVLAATKAIAMTTTHKALIVGTLIAVVGAAVYQAHRASTLQVNFEALQRTQPPLAEEVKRLTRERDEAAVKIAALQDENARLKKETSEVPRLRGRIAAAQQAQRELSVQLPEDDPGFKVRHDKMNYLANWGLALKLYAGTNNGLLPASLADAASSMPNPDAFFSSVGSRFQAEDFEVLFRGPLTNIEESAAIIVVREKEPVRVSNGSWVRAYLFGDGHTETKLSADGDFKAWEQEHLLRESNL